MRVCFNIRNDECCIRNDELLGGSRRRAMTWTSLRSRQPSRLSWMGLAASSEKGGLWDLSLLLLTKLTCSFVAPAVSDCAGPIHRDADTQPTFLLPHFRLTLISPKDLWLPG